MVKINLKLVAILGLFLIPLVNSLTLDTENQNRLNFGHVVLVNDIRTDPEEMISGKPAILSVNLTNSGNFFVNDIRAKLALPAEMGFYNDISEEKISRLESLDQKEIHFHIITLPDTKDGIYKGSLNLIYLNNVGEEKEDNYSIGFLVKSIPNIFVELENSEITTSNSLGDISLNFVNNGLSDIKFLTVELLSSEEYEIFSSSKKYIGDLDSDDFSSIDYRIKVKNNKKDIILPLKISYKDSLNKDYSENIEVKLIIRSSNELGIKSPGSWIAYLILLILIIFVFYHYYWHHRPKKHSNLT